jgi:hypothetical protein
MNSRFAGLLVVAVLAGCGGSDGVGGMGGTGGSGDTGGSPPPPPQGAGMAVLSGDLARQVALSTSVSLEIVVRPGFTPSGTLYVQAEDKDNLVLPDVQVTARQDGTWALSADTRTSAPAGHYKGELTLKLCADKDCAVRQAVPAVSVPYDIAVVRSGSAWPGDNLKPINRWTDVPDWSMFQGNAAHTGYVPVELKPDQFSLRWKTGPIQSSGLGASGSEVPGLTAANGLIYTSAPSALKARTEFDGSTVWTYDLSTLRWPSVNAPAISGGVLYMAAGQQESTFMFGLDAATGALRFKTPMGSQWESYLAPVVLNGAVYTNAGTYGGMYGFTTEGEQLFFVSSLPQVSMWTPAADDKALYAYVGNKLVMFEQKTGVELSHIDTLSTGGGGGYDIQGSAVLGSPGCVFAAYYSAWSSNELLKFNTDKGYVDWRIPGSYRVTPGYAGGVVFAPNRDPFRLEARAESDGALLWSWTPPIAGESTWLSSPIITRNLLFVSTDFVTYAVDLRSHKVVWSYPLAGKLALTQSGVLYIQSREALVAVTLK